MPADRVPPADRPDTGAPAGARPTPRRWAAPFLDPTPITMRRIALAGILANAGIMMTGAAVRLSDSGLGCPDWPQCTPSSLVAAHTRGEPLFHTWIEFGNRMLTYVLLVVAVAAFTAAWRFRPGGARRKDLVWLAAGQPIGVLLQAVLGGIVVLTNLNPAWVSVHFMVSIAVVAVAVLLYVRCAEGTGPARSLVRVDQRLMARGLVALVALMLAAGTVVTGTGPLAGSGDVARYHLPLEGVTQLHADIGWMLGMLVAVLVLSLKLTGAPQRVTRVSWLMFCLVGVQGAIGYAQYFSGLPAGLVWVHVAVSVVIWIVALRLMFATRDRGQVTGTRAGRTQSALSPPTAAEAARAGA